MIDPIKVVVNYSVLSSDHKYRLWVTDPSLGPKLKCEFDDEAKSLNQNIVVTNNTKVVERSLILGGITQISINIIDLLDNSHESMRSTFRYLVSGMLNSFGTLDFGGGSAAYLLFDDNFKFDINQKFPTVGSRDMLYLMTPEEAVMCSLQGFRLLRISGYPPINRSHILPADSDVSVYLIDTALATNPVHQVKISKNL